MNRYKVILRKHDQQFIYHIVAASHDDAYNEAVKLAKLPPDHRFGSTIQKLGEAGQSFTI